MKSDSKFARVVLVSPWFLLIFFIVPLSVILLVTMHVRLPFAGPIPLFINNTLFTILVLCRFLRYLVLSRKPIRYGESAEVPKKTEVLPLSADGLRTALEKAGYAFAASGRYGERRDLGFVGTTLLYGGLCVVLFFGTWDNLRQFSGTLLDGQGPPTKLSQLDKYKSLSRGPLAREAGKLPQMRITKQFLPSRQYPQGATEVVFLTPDERELKTVLKPGEPFPYEDFDIMMNRIVFEPEILIRTDKQLTVIDQFVKLYPLVEKMGDFSFFGTFAQGNLDGDVLYQPEKNRVKVVMRRDGKRVMNTELIFQGERLVDQADLVLSVEKMGQWSEIRVVHRRHLTLIGLGAVIAVIGLLLRIAVTPQRVWVEESGEGCRARAAGRETVRLIEAARG